MKLADNRRGVQRESNLELYRILVMLAIIAHHYVVNSGLVEKINESSDIKASSCTWLCRRMLLCLN